MKKLIILFIIALFSLVACEDILDVKPKQDIPQDIAFNDEASVRSTIVGCYDALQSTGYYGRYYVVVPDLLAGNLEHNGTTQEYAEFTNNAVQSDNFIIDGIWSSIYDGINRVNMVIANIDQAGMSTEDENMYLAHAYFLRALHHFNLVRMFGGVPIKREPSTEPGEQLNVPRNSISEVYTQIELDLDFAEQHITDIFPGAANLTVLNALRAKISLYQERWTDAKFYATEVINDNTYGLEPYFGDLYPAGNSMEGVFEILFNEQDNNLLAQYFLPTAIGGRHEFIPSESFINSFPEEDSIRLNNSVTEDSDGLYCSKYTEISTRSDNVYVFRLAEMYLIRAEAEAQLQGNINDIQSDINMVRNRSDLGDTEASTYEELLQAVAIERRRELAFEGHYWFDLVRTGSAMDSIPEVTSENQYLMPIPLSEMQTNDAMEQNPDY